MQIPLLLVETASKGISLHLDLRNYTRQHGLSSKTRTVSQGEIFMPVSSRVPFLYLKNKQPNLSGRLTSSSHLALSRSSSVQRSFFCGDVIAITSWTPDVNVVNLVRPFAQINFPAAAQPDVCSGFFFFHSTPKGLPTALCRDSFSYIRKHIRWSFISKYRKETTEIVYRHIAISSTATSPHSATSTATVFYRCQITSGFKSHSWALLWSTAHPPKHAPLMLHLLL